MKPTLKFQIVTILMVLFITNQSIAQSNTEEIASKNYHKELSKHSIYLDLNVAGFSQFSINYELKLSSNEKITWYGRIGVGYGSIFLAESGHGGLGGLTMLTGKGNHHFEGSFGVFVGNTNNGSDLDRSFLTSRSQVGNTFFMPIIDAGYRYQKPGGGLIFKAKIANIGIGVGLGWAF